LLRSVGKDGTTESELQNMDTKDPTKSAKKCMKNAMLCTKTAPRKAKANAKAKTKTNANERQGNGKQGKAAKKQDEEQPLMEVPRPAGTYMLALQQAAPWITAKRGG